MEYFLDNSNITEIIAAFGGASEDAASAIISVAARITEPRVARRRAPRRSQPTAREGCAGARTNGVAQRQDPRRRRESARFHSIAQRARRAGMV